MSIPRLELKGALLLADIMHKVKKSLNIDAVNVFGWIDAKAALCWIKAPPERWKPFVRHRVSAIQEIIPSQNWNYVNTTENPADLVSRGCDIHTMKASNLWFQGPSWLGSGEVPSKSSVAEFDEMSDEILQEETKKKVTCHVAIETKSLQNLLEKYSSFEYLCIIIAWIIRFTNKRKKSSTTCAKFVTITECNAARKIVVRQIQHMTFSDEIENIKLGKELPRDSKILSLNPFIDEDGLLRVGGRISRANIPFQQKHPIILPPSGPCIMALVRDAHIQTLHGGKQLTLNLIRQQFWIINGARAVKSVIYQCMRCHRNSSKLQQQLMGQLPEPRINFTKAFLHTGVDFAGPISIKAKAGRGIRSYKAYIALFVCMATKAIHLELVNSLSSEDFIAALKRFVARRGTVQCLYSDNGTNFVGAFRKLKRIFEMMRGQQIEWKFNPPSAPHFGGLWEAGVKSVKFHLKRILGHSIFTAEEMNTVLCQIESCLNSRPLCPLTDDIEDLDVLTPNHFLTGQNLIPIVEEDFMGRPENMLKRWQFCMQKYQEVCVRYKNEYLHRLQQRPKWLKSYSNLKIGQLFLIKEDSHNISHWPLGRIVETHPGSDGLVRVVTLKTKNGMLKRPITKLSPLPIETTLEDENPATSSIKVVRRSARIKNRSNLFMTILVTLFLLAIANAQSIRKFKNQPGIHFKKEGTAFFTSNYWTLTVQQNMTDYTEGIRTINNSIETLNQICRNVSFNCIPSLTGQFRIINETMELINTSRRQSRVAPIIVAGVGIASLIGITAYQQMETYSLKKELVDLQSRQSNLLELMHKHTEWMEIASGIFDKTTNHITSNKTNQLIQNTTDFITQLEVHQQIQDVFLASEFIIRKLESLQDLICALRMHKSPRYSIITTLSLFHLENSFEEISSQLPAEQRLPKYHLPEELLLRTTFKFELNHIEFQFKIPIILNREYAILKLFPIPIDLHNEMIWIEPSSTYIAWNGSEAVILSMDLCKKIGKSHICTTANHNADNEKLHCELSILLNKKLHSSCLIHSTNVAETWIRINDETWAFTLPHAVPIHIGNITTNLTDSGLLSYTQKFEEHNNNTLIIPETCTFLTPALNLSDWVKNKERLYSISFDAPIRADLQSLRKKLSSIQNLETIQSSPHSTWISTSNVGVYVTLGLCILVFTWKFNKLRKEMKPINHIKSFEDII